MPDSPENKCPKCGSDDPLVIGEACGYHPLHTPHRWHVEAPRVDGSGRVNTSGGEADTREDSAVKGRGSGLHTSPDGLATSLPVDRGFAGKFPAWRLKDEPDPQCPDCGGMGSDGGGFRGGKKWKAICPSCGGSGRSPVDSGTGCAKHGRSDCEDCYLDALAPGTGTDENGDARIEGKTIACSDFVDDGYLLCLAFTDGSEAQIERESDRPITIRWTRASVPSSPHETGQKLPTSEEEFAAALLVSFEQGKVAGRRWCPDCGAETTICECPKRPQEPSKWEREFQALEARSPSPDRETGADELVIEEHVPCEGDCEFCKETARAALDKKGQDDG